MAAVGLPNTVGIYGISNIPKDIAAIWMNYGVKKVVYFADNDTGGEIGASNLATLLHKARWQGEAEYRKFVGPGIPHKGDANDLLCHHYPDIAAARAALDALPRFTPSIKREPDTQAQAVRKEYSEGGWDAVNQAITDALGLHATDFKTNGFTKNFNCLNPQHEDKTASAGWSRDGHYNCFYCGKINRLAGRRVAEHRLARPAQIAAASARVRRQAQSGCRPASGAGNSRPGSGMTCRPWPCHIPHPRPRTRPRAAGPGCTPSVISASQTSRPRFGDHKVIALRAQQGGGKTYALYQMARQAMRSGKRVLWLAPNISQTERARTQLPDALHYAELQRRGDIVSARSAITTWKSLRHFRRDDGSVTEFDLIIADEFHLALPQLAGEIFRDDEALVAIETAADLLSAAGQVIAASADMTGLEVEWLHELSGQPVYIIDNPHTKPLPPAAEYHNHYRMLDEALTLAAGADAPVFIGLGSKRQARALCESARERGLSEADIALVTADTQRERPDIRALVADPDAHCGRYRLILYTSAISEGFSYSGPCAGAFVSASNQNLTPVRYSQMLHRARAAERYGFAPIYTLNDSRLTDADAILAQQLARHLDNGFTASAELLQFGRWTARHMAQKNQMRQDPASLLRQLLVNQGHGGIQTDSRSAAQPFVEAMKAARDLVHQRDAQSTLFSRPLSSGDYRRKLLGISVTEDDRYGRDRDRIEMGIGQYLTPELYDRYHRRAERRRLHGFERLLAPEEEAIRRDRGEEERRLPLHRRGNHAQTWRLEQVPAARLAGELGIDA